MRFFGQSPQNDIQRRYCGLDPQSQKRTNAVNNKLSYSSEARVSSRLNLDENKKLDSQSCRFENDERRRLSVLDTESQNRTIIVMAGDDPQSQSRAKNKSNEHLEFIEKNNKLASRTQGVENNTERVNLNKNRENKFIPNKFQTKRICLIFRNKLQSNSIINFLDIIQERTLIKYFFDFISIQKRHNIFIVQKICLKITIILKSI